MSEQAWEIRYSVLVEAHQALRAQHTKLQSSMKSEIELREKYERLLKMATDRVEQLEYELRSMQQQLWEQQLDDVQPDDPDFGDIEFRLSRLERSVFPDRDE